MQAICIIKISINFIDFYFVIVQQFGCNSRTVVVLTILWDVCLCEWTMHVEVEVT